MTVALVQTEAPVGQLLQEAVVESRYVDPEQAEHFAMLLATTQVEHI